MNETQATPEVSPEMNALLEDPSLLAYARNLAVRYLYSPITDCLVPGSIPAGWFPKGRFYPVAVVRRPTLRRDENINTDAPTKIIEEIYPGEIVESVLGRYAPRGAVEIKTLFGMPIKNFEALGLNELFFGAMSYDGKGQVKAPSLPEMQEHFERVRERAESSRPEVRAKLEAVMVEVTSALAQAESYVREALDDSHGDIAQGRRGNLDFRLKYDQRDLMHFSFLGQQPETEAWRTAPAQTAEAPPAPVFDWDGFTQNLQQTIGQAVSTAVQATVKEVVPVVAKAVAEGQAAPRKRKDKIAA